HFGPFGIGNPKPVFLSRGVRVAGRARTVGKGHLKLRLSSEGQEIEAIGFGMADRVDPGTLGAGPLDALFQLQVNEFRGTRSLQARLLDLRPSTGTGAG